MAVLEDKKEIYDNGEPSWRTNLQNDELEAAYDSPSATDEDLPDGHPSKSKSLSSKEISEKEVTGDKTADAEATSKEGDDKSDGGDDKIGGGYKSEKPTVGQRVKGFGRRNRKKMLIGGGIGGGLGAVLISIIMSLLPLKLTTIMENLKGKYFGTGENAVSRRMNYHMSVYLKNHVMPGMAKSNDFCKSTKTITKDCIADITGETPAKKLYRGWRDARLENKLALNYGIEFEYRTAGANGNRFFMKSPDIKGEVAIDDLGTGNHKTLGDYEQVKGTQFIARLNSSMEGEAKWRKMLVRHRVLALVKRKYNTNFCTINCKVDEKLKIQEFQSWRNSKVEASKLVMTKVLETHSQIYGLALSCVISSDCDTDSTDKTTDAQADPDVADLQHKDPLEKNIAAYLEKRGIELDKETVESLAARVGNIKDSNSFGQFIFKEIAQKIESEALEKFADKAVPIVGQINLAAQVLDKAANLPKKLSRWGSDISKAATAAVFVSWVAAADEAKEGNTDAKAYGSLVSALGDNAGDADHLSQPAESSPLYQDILGNQNTKTSLLDIFNPSSALAAPATTPSGYTCDDKTPVPAGELVCPEEKIGNTNSILGFVDKLFATPPFNILKEAAGVWQSTVGRGLGFVSSIFGDIISAVPGVSQLQDKIGELAGNFIQEIGKKVFHTAVGPNMSGGRLFNVLAAGADGIGGDFAQYGLGGSVLTPGQVAEIENSQAELKQQEFSQKPFFARMFSTSDTSSMISHLALATPTNTVAAAQKGLGSVLTNPMATIFSSFGTMFTTKRTYAATVKPDAFGLPQFGYALNDNSVNIDGNLLTKEYCTKMNKDWANSVEIDELTGLDIHKTTNPCLLESATVAAVGGYFSDEALGDTPGSAVASPAVPVTPGVIGGDSSSSTCTAGTDAGIGDGYQNNVLYKIRICKVQGIVVNAQIADKLDKMLNSAKAAGINLGGGGFRTMQGQIDARKTNGCPNIYFAVASSCNPPTARPGFSNHQMGLAIDFTSGGGTIRSGSAAFNWLKGNAATYGFKNLPSESWHWSVDGH